MRQPAPEPHSLTSLARQSRPPRAATQCAHAADPPAPPPEPPEQKTEESKQTSTALAERPRPSIARRPPQQLPPFRVLLHNDDVNTPEFVIESLVELTPHNNQAATLIMLEAHLRGLALILVTHQERAELYRDQLRSKRLTVTIEPAE